MFECLSDEDNGLFEVLHCPELIVPSGEINCKVVQGHWATRAPLRAKVEGISVGDNSLIEFFHCPEWKDGLQGYSKTLSDQGALADKG